MKRRNTPQKQAILDLFKSQETALNQENIERILIDQMNRTTIYRILKNFCSDGILHKIQSDDGTTYYALCNNCKNDQHHHNHFHFRCENCKELICLKEEVKPMLPEGFEMNDLNCVITGYCSKCKKTF